MNDLPPCCASCPELDGTSRRCRLLARPTLDARHRLLTMPCSVARLLRQRFRGHPAEIGQRALLAWVNPARTPEATIQSYGELSLDARIWTTSWPQRELARAEPGEGSDVDENTAVDAPARPLGPAAERALDAIARCSLIDPVGALMVLEAIRGDYEPADFRAALGATDAREVDLLLAAFFRHLCTVYGVLERLPPEEAIALRVRRFSQGDPTDAAALVTTRGAFARPDLRLEELRAMIASGVDHALELLAADLGHEVVGRIAPSLRRVLRVGGDGPAVDEPARVRGALAQHLAETRAAIGGVASASHLDGGTIARLSDPDVPVPERRAIVGHLAVCADGRCVRFARWEVGGARSVKLDLAGPLSEPPPGAAPEPLGPTSPRLIQCRDVLWESFASMADAEGRSVDDLVNDAMSRYRVLRESVDARKGRRGATRESGRGTAPSEAAIRAHAGDFDEDDVTRVEGYRKLSPKTGVEARSIVFDLPPRSLPLAESSAPPPPPGREDDEPAPPTARIAPTWEKPASAAASPVDPTPKSSENRDTTPLGHSHAPVHAGRRVDSTEGPVPDPPSPENQTPASIVPSVPGREALAESFAQLDEEVGENQRETTSPKMFASPLQPPLFLEYLGRKYHVSHPRFVIGREKGSCHLLIADANVSRQHAVIEWNAGNYYMVDQGSTNGVGCGGHRIHRKQIVEGDRFEISGHVLMFTFRM